MEQRGRRHWSDQRRYASPVESGTSPLRLAGARVRACNSAAGSRGPTIRAVGLQGFNQTLYKVATGQP